MASEYLSSLVAMLAIGLAGSGHCVGMCGGISSALGFGANTNKVAIAASYHCGRITSYALAGCAIGLLGMWSNDYLGATVALRVAAGLLLILMGLYLADWWRALVWLEKGGAVLWRRIQPLGNRFLPVTSFASGFQLGLVWGWLPCGLVYSALVYAAAAGNPLESASLMVAFGLGTTPAVFAGSFFSQYIRSALQKNGLRRIMAVCLMAFGVWTILGGIGYFHSPSLPEGPAESGVHHHSHRH